jgi:molecular chaperone HscB
LTQVQATETTLHSDDFALFGLPRRFAQDPAEIDARWKALQRQAHPDRFASQGEAAQRLAMQWAVRINEARQRLLDPVRRAAYLCSLDGFPVRAEDNTAMPPAFLMQQMAWREALEDAQDAQALEALRAEIEAARARTLAAVEQALDTHHDPKAAAEAVRQLMFIDRIRQALLQKQHELAEARERRR